MSLIGRKVLLKDGQEVRVERHGSFFPETHWQGPLTNCESTIIEFDANDIFEVIEE